MYVYFPKTEDLSQGSLEAPYLSSSFSNSPAVAQAPALEAQTSKQRPISLAPNSILFGLGVTLLELAFGSPIRDLQHDKDRKDGQANEYTDYFAARRLGTVVSTVLGRRYGKLVNKCLYCDFGLGGSYEMTSTDLQSAFFHDVVCELDKCFTAALVC